MNRNPEREVPTKQEASVINDKGPTNSRRCATQKNPRIVCVSRSHGGKDRHSKVSTIRGLRDRRVRLSVQTAIQLYDLQEKLGVNQPSKVVDWLLNAAKHEINKLPPLSIQVSNGKFVQLPQNIMVSHEITSPQAFQQGYTVVDKARRLALSSDIGNFVVGDVTTLPNSTYWNSDVLMKTKQEEKEPIVRNGNLVKGNDEEHQRVGMMSNDMPYASHHNWENAYPTHLGSHSFQVEPEHNFRSSRPFIPSLQPGSQLEMFSSMVNPSVFSSYMTSSTNFSLPNS